MTSADRKRRWRELHPERRREAERRRAQARRDGYKSIFLGQTPPCASSESYLRYESSIKRRLQHRRRSMDLRA
jgi:hypothetical protein